MTTNMEKPRVLIVDDDDDVRTQMKWALNENYDVLLAEDRAGALKLLGSKPHVVTLDLGLPPFPGDTREGFLALSDLLQFDPLIKVLVITGQGEKENGIEAIGQGAFDFFSKPVNIDELKIVLERAIHVQELERERRQLLESDRFDSFEGLLGTSPQIQKVFATIEKVSTSDASVLISGESGTGKELVARAIHRRSLRKDRPFIAINCGAIPENLLESELFGHEKGAFTGAHIQRLGRIEMAQGGTLFLDEIGELSPVLQVKLLRFLQEHQIERVGGRTLIPVDARVIAATNVDLTKAMAGGRFREDLYYRLAVVVAMLPPLREREGDIACLAKAFLQQQAASQQKNLVFTPKAIRAMESHAWPGNVRELENRIQRAAIMAENGRITPADIGLTSVSSEFEGQSLGKAREAVERQMVESALARNKGNLTRAAAELEISRPSLYELIERLGIPRR
jgi:two-component system NtrC family response regulator